MPRILTSRSRSLVPSILVVVALTGCSPAGSASVPSSSPAPSTVSEPTPTNAEADADPDGAPGALVSIVVRPETLELRDDRGASREYDYLGDPDEVVLALAEAFDAEPVLEEWAANSHFPPTTAHRWEGLVLWEHRHVDRWEEIEHSIFRPRFSIRFTGPSALGVELVTANGRHPGDPWDELLAAPGLRTNPSRCSGPYLDFIEVTRVDADGSDDVVPVVVDFWPTDDQALIASVGAPIPAWEDC
ncbi:hypothetical protein [Agromyces sp. SYSU T0242]|uniref:hypothetical protein n=1 Tax=Agromyces litoreus TaxID=3158561 RepID=UPI0033933610